MKQKAIADMTNNKKSTGGCIEIINGHKVIADVYRQNKNSSKAICCNWYLNGKKSSAAKVVEAIS
jgi:hypothetical protein